MQVSSSTTLSSSAIALKLLRDDPGGGATSTATGATRPPAKVDALADRDLRQDNAIRIGQRNVYAQALDQFHMSYATAAKLGLAIDAQTEALVDAVPQALDRFPPEDAQRLAALGADAAVLTPEYELDKAAFDDLVAPFIRESLSGQPGFQEALAAGTLMIRRVSEVPEFNFGHNSYSLFKDGNMIGGGAWGRPFNQALYDRVAATGIEQAFGGVMGQNFYATWPGKAAASV